MVNTGHMIVALASEELEGSDVENWLCYISIYNQTFEENVALLQAVLIRLHKGISLSDAVARKRS